MKKRNLIISIDFDDTIVNTEQVTKIKGLRQGADSTISKWFNQGAYIIINTCRGVDTPSGLDAELFLFENKIPHHQMNRQSVFSRALWKKDVGKKIYADLYIDDKNLDWALNGIPDWVEIDRMVQEYIAKNQDKFNILPSISLLANNDNKKVTAG